MSLMSKLIKSYAKKENDLLKKSIELQKEKLPKSVIIERDLNYETTNGQGRMTVYHPVCEEKLPVIINIHGGGMVCGMMEQNDLLCANLAKEGYVVFAIEYPLLPDVDVFDIYRILAQGINKVSQLAEQYNGNLKQVFWTGDSAGAYLITNLAILRSHEDMRESFGVPSITTPIKALGLISGMFYVNKKDKIGMSMPNMMFGKGYKNTSIFQYTNMEKPEYIECLPPIYMVSSYNDMLREHTLCYYEALMNRSHKVKLRMFEKDKRLVHAFVALYPDYPESEIAYKEMLEFFKEEA